MLIALLFVFDDDNQEMLVQDYAVSHHTFSCKKRHQRRHVVNTQDTFSFKKYLHYYYTLYIVITGNVFASSP